MMPSHILDDVLSNVIIRVNKSWKMVQKKCLVLSEHFNFHTSFLKRTTLLGLCLLAYRLSCFTSK